MTGFVGKVDCALQKGFLSLKFSQKKKTKMPPHYETKPRGGESGMEDDLRRIGAVENRYSTTTKMKIFTFHI